MGTPTPAYRVMRKVWPHVPRDLRRRIGRRTARGGPPAAGGVLAGVGITDVAASLAEDGVVVLDRRLPAEMVVGLRRLASRLPARPVGGGAPVVVDRPDAMPEARYDLPEDGLLADPTVQALLVDPSLRELADTYLGGEAVNDLAAMWWSVAQPGGPNAAAAQQFHTDRDRLSFVKVFVYLTDVDEAHGPHVYVKGSHRHLPARLRHDRRYRDEEVLDAFGPDALVQLTGPAGTVFAADTGGLHKGLAPQVGHRLVFQLEFATNLFGAPYTRGDGTSLGADTKEMASAHPRAYRRLLADA